MTLVRMMSHSIRTHSHQAVALDMRAGLPAWRQQQQGDTRHRQRRKEVALHFDQKDRADRAG